MNEINLESLTFFIILWVPGFISVKIHDLLIPPKERDYSKSIYEVISYSLFNYALLSPLLYLGFQGNFYLNFRLLFFVILVFTYLVFPILLPIILINLRKSKCVIKYIQNPTTTSWNYIFEKRRAYWIIIHTTDNKKIGGIYGPESYATSYPEEEQIYVEKLWEMPAAGGFGDKIPNTAGGLFFKKDIKYIEFINDTRKEEKKNV